MSCFLFTTRHRQRKEGISLEGAELKRSDRSQEQTEVRRPQRRRTFYKLLPY
jgi:hypothetical protein